MIRRCHTPSASGFHKYGAKGLKVCDLWRNSFEEFLKDMGDPPEGLSIDRIDNSKGYFKENCRWATLKEQSRNKTTNIYLTIDGVQKTLVEWVEIYSPIYGLKYQTVKDRISRKWDAKEALTKKALKR
jgi:hypothetical protein